MSVTGAGLRAGQQRRLELAANLVLLLGVVACLGVLARALAELHAGVGLDQLVTFYFLPALLGLALASAFRLAPGTRINLALLLVALAFSALSAEAALLVTSRGQDGLPLATDEKSVEALSLHDVVMDLRAMGDHAYPRVPGNVLVNTSPRFPVDSTWIHPLTPAPGGATVVLCNEGGEPVSYQGDRFGFDNDDGVWDLERMDLVLLGDSYVHGVCVDAEHRIAAYLRARWATLNLGMSGAGPLLELAVLREYGAHLAPSAVVWVYYEGNDPYDLAAEGGRDWLVDYLGPEHRQGLRAHRVALDLHYASWLDSVVAAGPNPLTGRIPRPGLGQLAREAPRLRTLRNLARFGVAFPSRRPPLGLLPTVLRQAKDDVEAWGGRLLLVYMPAFVRYDIRLGGAPTGHEELIRFARDEGIRLLDLDDTFRATGDPRALWAHPRGHLDPVGYRVAAEAIAAAVDSLEAVP